MLAWFYVIIFTLVLRPNKILLITSLYRSSLLMSDAFIYELIAEAKKNQSPAN